MRKRYLIILILLIVNLPYAQGQGKKRHVKKRRDVPENGIAALGAGIGMFRFVGDLGNEKLSNYSYGYHLGLEKRFKNYVSFAASAHIGKLRASENTTSRNLNFESKVFLLELKAIGHLDNDLVFKRRSVFSPYLATGISYLQFDPHGDLIDATGKTYYYWKDGRIRDLPESEDNKGIAQQINKDYAYETQLFDSLKNYARSTFAIPFTLGFKLKLWRNMETRIASTYYLTASDYIDNLGIGKSKDKFIYTSISLQYTFGNKDPAKSRYEKVDFSGIVQEDTDGDGISDMDDLCANTPKEAKVNASGCPLDEDDDGVPDYLDKEQDTKKNAPVDENGVTISDETFKQMQIARDSIPDASKHVKAPQKPIEKKQKESPSPPLPKGKGDK